VAVSPTQQRLAAALKHLRARSGMSAAELGRRLGWTQTRVSRAENGGRRVSVTEATEWAEATNAPTGLRAEVIELAEAAVQHVRSWWNVHAGGMADRQLQIAELEASAEVVRNTQHVIPGILQTAEYARHALELANVSGQTDISTAVANRMRRQEALYNPAHRWEYVLPEAALRARLSGDPVMTRAQADRLLSLDTLPNISIAVLPFSTPWPVWPAPFVLYEIPGESIVVIEYLTGEVTIGEDRQVAMYREAFTRLREAAVAGEDAHQLIHEAMTQV
jgi:transcriptional regulator with XRE-family HTH domain